MDDFAKLSIAIKNARIANSMSQEELAEKLNISATHVKHMESGHRKPSVEILFSLAKILNISVDSILFGDSAPDSSEMMLNSVLAECTKKEKMLIAEITKAVINSRTEN